MEATTDADRHLENARNIVALEDVDGHLQAALDDLTSNLTDSDRFAVWYSDAPDRCWNAALKRPDCEWIIQSGLSPSAAVRHLIRARFA